MVKYCDLAICDSVNIEKYIHKSDALARSTMQNSKKKA